MITGKDPVSLQVLEAFTKKQKLADIATAFNLSLDQVKRLKRLYNYTNNVLMLTNAQTTEQFKALGTKGLFLAPYIKNKDARALTEIIASTTEQTTRDELLNLIDKYKAKQERIQAFEATYEKFLNEYTQNKQLTQLKIDELEQAKELLLEKYDFVKAYEPAVQELLIYYVGIHQDGYFGLRRRLDSGFRKALVKKNILHLNTDYIWVIHSVHAFAQQLSYRLKHDHYIQWDYEREMQRMRNNDRGALQVTKSEDYKAIQSYLEETKQIERQIAAHEAYLKSLTLEKEKLEAELKADKKASIQSFEEASIASNLMSDREILRHKEMQVLAMKWLYNQGFIVASEVTLPNKQRADVIAYNTEKVIIIEVKSSREDYKQDHKWLHYLPYCDEFYFFLDFYTDDRQEKQVGFLEEQARTLQILQQDTIPHQCEHIQAVHWSIGRTLSKKVTFGWD